MSKALLELANIRESLAMAMDAVRTNKLRSILTLVGIVVGVFSIISVMTAMGVLRNSIEEGLAMLGANTFQIQKFPVGFNRGRDFARFRNRKDLSYNQGLQVQAKATLAEAVGIESWEFGRIIRWSGEKTNPNVSLAGENLEGIVTNDWLIETGRGLSTQDVDLSSPVVVLGDAVAEMLFPPHINPVDETVRIDGTLYRVIGVYEKKYSALGGNNDNFVTIPITTYFHKYGKAEKSVHIMVKAKSREVYQDCLEQTRAILRAARHVPPGEEDDFAYFSNDSLITQFNELTFYLRIGVLLVSCIALLAAGVGIMNIMLVSVTERTREIGVRKALGARKSNILSQFIIEAVILCQIGGIVGIVLGIIGGNIVGLVVDVPAIIPWDWVGVGLAVCTIVGLIFGVYPAWKASLLDPIESLRYE
ncbi:MAG: ABC transporter permease [Ignavibacteria bacterium]|nr:ABC transporter permease [Ignavibacteria bacterium]